MTRRILLIERNLEKSEFLWKQAIEYGFDPALAFSFESAATEMENRSPIGGMIIAPTECEIRRRYFLKSLRASLRTNRTPIIVIASPGNEDDCIRTLEDGADDYMTTPFSHAELFARMNAIVRSQHTLALESVVVADGLSLNPETRRIFITDSQTRREIFLRQNEFEILKLLLKHKNQTLSREAIINAIWGTSGQVLPRIIDVSIYRIRKGLRSAGRERMIETIPNQGYRLVAQPAAAPPS